ncbi:MAG: 4-hydroxythreonine-4-phosphate dehydrogenase PdxA, partial [Acetobacteraceae bacterium]
RSLAEAMPGAGAAGVINVLGRIWTARVTSHVPLRRVAELITEEAILGATELLDRSFASHYGRRPRMAIAGLNPHAGDGGSFGMEEIEVIAPAVARAAGLGFAVEGPVPADTAYVLAARGRYDGIVTMFHDQGQIALKAVGFGEGITLSAGLRVPVATPSHGTAYDIAGRGIGRLDGLRLAVEVCTRLAQGAA